MMNKIPFKTLTLFLLILIGNLSLADEKKNSVFASLKGKLIELKDGKVTYREKVAKNVGRVRDVKLSPEGLIHIAVENKGIFRLNPKNE